MVNHLQLLEDSPTSSKMITSIYLQRSASMQPRTDCPKSLRVDPTRPPPVRKTRTLRMAKKVPRAPNGGHGDRPAGRAELLAKRGCIGQIQRPAELVPIPEYLLRTSLVPPESSQKSREIFVKIWQILENFQNCILRKFWQKLLVAKNILTKNLRLENGAKEYIV